VAGTFEENPSEQKGSVQLIFITFDDDLYLYTVNPTLWWGKLDSSLAYYYPPAIKAFVDMNVKTARITHGGVVFSASSSADDYTFTQIPVSLVWLKNDGTVWAQGINSAGEHGTGSVMTTEAYYPPVFTSAPTFFEYIESLGYTTDIGVSYAGWLAGKPCNPNSIYVWGAGGVSVLTAEGRGLQDYYNDWYIPGALWSVGNWLFALFNSSLYIPKRKVLDGPYTDLTTLGHLPPTNWISRTQHYWDSPGASATFLIDRDQKLYAMGMHGSGQLGDYSETYWYTGGVYPPHSNILEHSTWVYSEIPVQLFSTKLFNKLHKTNTLHTAVRDSVSSSAQLQSVSCTDGYTYLWGAGNSLTGYYKLPAPHKIDFENVKFFDRDGIFSAFLLYDTDEILLVTSNDDVYTGKFYLFTEPTFTFRYNLKDIVTLS